MGSRWRGALRSIINVYGLVMSITVFKMGLWHLLYKKDSPLSTVRLIQLSYTIEILNSVLGVTSQHIPSAIMQIGSRVFVSCFLCTPQHAGVVYVMLCCWGLSDSLRFLYYLVPWFKNLRYIASLVLYPLGVLCEVYLMLYTRGITSLIAALVYIPGFVYLYGRVLRKLSVCRIKQSIDTTKPVKVTVRSKPGPKPKAPATPTKPKTATPIKPKTATPIKPKAPATPTKPKAPATPTKPIRQASLRGGAPNEEAKTKTPTRASSVSRSKHS
ncbi:hypothetical protein NEDG_00424 [Nematocida displodere]|uniref:Very-long-chain (3R)-3-hydroxyacyl-CoA dehydratase n=1 Tax=Nematocida displodere TaxID=1805483 RepID=A0A177ELU1_9MICR|nr:hypothetical protein NEDG_00424 [Nematocida displodere]